MFVGSQIILLLFQAILALLVSYLLLLTVAAWRASRQTARRSDEPTHRFLILTPAHNEELLLPELLANLDQLDYPRALYAVHVVADNCTDQTAELGRRGGAIVHERANELQRGKGYALQWLLQRLQQANEPHDAVLILDADSVISPNFLRVMDARLARGERVIQSYYAVRDPDRSWSVSLRYVALAMVHYLRPLGRMVLGGSMGLKGNGMVFVADILKRHEWSASITEDIEFHMALVLAGERAMFAPDAIVEAEMPQTLAGSHTQNTRWEQGRLDMARRYVPALLRESRAAVKKGEYGRAYLLFDAVMEHIIPPFSLLTGLIGLGLLTALILFLLTPNISPAYNSLRIINLVIGIINILGQIIYIFYGLYLVRAPKKVYKALLYAPAFMAWKIWLYVRIMLGRGQEEWVRTARNET
ncbi:MAG: glycosyltransferase [Chloroflexi bacterium]|nr:glycosyltransferase [Chloroflexota bacterium]